MKHAPGAFPPPEPHVQKLLDRIVELETALLLVTKDRDTLLEMTGTTIQQVAARLNAVRSGQETCPICGAPNGSHLISAVSELPEAPMPCPGFASGACVPGYYCGVRDGYAYPCPGQPCISKRSSNISRSEHE